MDRVACISLDEFPLQLLLGRRQEWSNFPTVVVDRESAQGVVLWVNAHARERRILPGMRYAAALSLSSALRGYVADNVEQPSPIGLEHLATLLDRTTLVPPQQRQIPGLINVNTAPPLVLRCLDLTDEQVDRIIEVRSSLDSEAKATPAWLLTEEVLDLDTFERIAQLITARGQQFTIEALGYADHIGMVTRLQVVVDMVGPIAQTVYYRDVSYLGARFPIREEDLENIRVR